MNLRASSVDLATIERTVVHDSPAAKLKGHQVQQVGQPWTETTTVFASNSGKVTIDPANPHEIAIAGRRYVLEHGAHLSVKNQDWVGEGTLLATEPAAKYRLVEVKQGHGPVRERLEYYSTKRGGWVQAGEHSTRRGAMVEKAGRDQLTRELDAQLAAAKTSPNAHDPARLHSYVRVQHQSARGHGFDDVIVEFRGDPPKAKIRIVEIKDYPARYAQLGMMSAIRENLRENMATLKKRLEKATKATDSDSRPEEFRALSKREIAALSDAVEFNEFQLELHVGPTTLVGSEARAGSVLAQLRHELMTSGEFGGQPGQVGKDVLARAPTRISQDMRRSGNHPING